jgi:hypothetical protein
MAAHSVKLKVEHPLNVGNLGVEFEVRRGGKLLGKLEVTQTTLEWTPAKARNPRKVSWQEFNDWVEARGGRPEGQARPAAAPSRDAEPDTVMDVDLEEEVDDELDTEVEEEDDAEGFVAQEVDRTAPPPARTSWV